VRLLDAERVATRDRQSLGSALPLSAPVRICARGKSLRRLWRVANRIIEISVSGSGLVSNSHPAHFGAPLCDNWPMPTRARKRPRDMNELAFQVVQEATGQAPQPAELPDTRNPAAVALSKLGASKGGHARAAALSPKRRSAIAKKAVQARWQKHR